MYSFPPRRPRKSLTGLSKGRGQNKQSVWHLTKNTDGAKNAPPGNAGGEKDPPSHLDNPRGWKRLDFSHFIQIRHKARRPSAKDPPAIRHFPMHLFLRIFACPPHPLLHAAKSPLLQSARGHLYKHVLSPSRVAVSRRRGDGSLG